MKAVCIKTSTQIAPFGDSAGEMAVDTKTLSECQAQSLKDAGFTLVSKAPDGERYLVFSDRTWFTPHLLTCLKRAGTGRLLVTDTVWNAWTGPLQDLDSPGLYEIGIREGGEPGWDDLPAIEVDLEFRDLELEPLHSSMEHAAHHPVRVGPAMVHQVDHWSHIVRVNQLVLAARMEEARYDWDTAGVFGKLWRLLAIVFKTRSLNGWKIASALSERGKDISVHPTAVVEFSILEDGCDIGPHTVIRGSIIGAGAKVDAHATVTGSVVGAGAKVGKYAFLNLCTLFSNAMVSCGDGFQASVFGKDSFVAWGCAILDLSFGRSIKVERNGPGSERVDTEQHFLGAAIGHRAKIGHGVKIGYGVSVPNDALLVDGGDFLRTWGDAPVGQPVILKDGRPVKP
jgi:acetyltransferase-like isoleucine patch superfamily enzyme